MRLGLNEKLNFLCLKKTEDYKAYINTFKFIRDNKPKFIPLIKYRFIDDMSISKYDLENRKHNNSKLTNIKMTEIGAEKKAEREKFINMLNINNENCILQEYFNLKNLFSRNFAIEGIEFNEEEMSVKVKLNYININTSQDVYSSHKSIGYAYNMFRRYFKDTKVEMEVTYLTWDINDRNTVRGRATNKNADNHRIFKNEYIKAGVPIALLNNIQTNYISLDLDKRYGVKSDY